ELDRNRLIHGERVQLFNTLFASQARVLHTTKRHTCKVARACIHPEIPSVDATRQHVCPPDISCPHTCSQPKVAIVRELDRFFSGVERRDSKHRTEDFFLKQT